MPLQARTLACLGGGANSPIYAVELPEGEPCTLKVFLGQDAVARAQGERDWRSRAEHRGIAPVRASYHWQHHPALAFPAIDGATLETLRSGTPSGRALLPARVAAAIGAAVGEALRSAPPALCTRQLSAEDVLVTAAGEVLVADPGSGPPLSGAEDPRALSYRLGALLFSLVTGRALPTPGALELPWERRLRRALEAAGVPTEAAKLLRRLVAWSPERRPRPEVAIARLRFLSEDLDGPTLVAWAASTAGLRRPSPETGTRITLEFNTETTRYAVGDDQEMLFFPDGGADADAPTELAEEPPLDVLIEPVVAEHAHAAGFDFPDQTEVHPFPPLFADDLAEAGPHEDERTDPEDFASVSAEDRTDPEPLHLPHADADTGIFDDEGDDAPAARVMQDPAPARSGVAESASMRGPWIVGGIMLILAAAASYAAAG